MNMDKISLSETHRRSISASLCVVERIVYELEYKLKFQEEMTMNKVLNNMGEMDMQHYDSLINKIKAYICSLYIKYDLTPTEIYLSSEINSKKARMWEILCETNSKGLKGYGKFPEEYAQEFDSDIDVLQKLIHKI